MTFRPDPQQRRVLDHDRGPMLVLGAAGTGKTAVLRERLARLVEEGADPERVVLIVRWRRAREEARSALLERLARPLPGLRVITVHGLAHLLMQHRYGQLDYPAPPEVLTAFDQLSTVRDLLAGEDPADWPAYGGLLRLRGFADEVRQFLNRAQEALLTPEDVDARARERDLRGWQELARFYRSYLDILAGKGAVDFAGLLRQAAAATSSGSHQHPLLDHVLVDDYQEATVAEEAVLSALAPRSLVVAGDPESHIFSFQGTTDVPIKRFTTAFRPAAHVVLSTAHRSAGPALRAWAADHVSEEHISVAREIRRVHLVQGVPWRDLAVVVRRGRGSDVAGLLRALDDAEVPRSTPQSALSLVGDWAVAPFVLALRWLGHPQDRDGLVESLLTSELVGLSPAAARGLIRATQADGQPPSAALGRVHGLAEDEAAAVRAVAELLARAGRVADRSVLDAFRALWVGAAHARRLVSAAESSPEARRALDAVTAFSEAVARAGDRADSSVQAFLDLVEAGEEEPELAVGAGQAHPDAVQVLTAHGTAGQEFHTVIVTAVSEGNFPSLARPEPMFDLTALDGPLSQSERNRRRLEDERRLFRMVAARARHRTLFTTSGPTAGDGAVAARSRFVAELGVEWTPTAGPPTAEPLSRAEAAAAWRRSLADHSAPPPTRLAALGALLQLGERPGGWWFQRDWTGTDTRLHDEVRVSFSRLEKLENCALQFVLSEELGLEGEAGYYAWVGHLVHGIIEDCEKGLVERTAEALAAAANERWREKEFPSRAVSEAFRRTVVGRILPNWLQTYGQTEALAGEVAFSFEFEGATVTGRIDRVGRVASGGSQITDYKTGKAKPGPVEDNLQLGIYFLAVGRSEELARFRPVKAVELAFLKEDRSSQRFRAHLAMTSTTQREFGERMAERLGALIRRVRGLLEAEVYRPSSQAECRYCDFKTLCPLWPEGRELFASPTAAEEQVR